MEIRLENFYAHLIYNVLINTSLNYNSGILISDMSDRLPIIVFQNYVMNNVKVDINEYIIIIEIDT